jgi:hypothetical protein
LPGEFDTTAAGFAVEGAVPYGREAMSMAFLRTPGHRAVVFRRHEQDGVAPIDLRAQVQPLGRLIAVEVLIVEADVEISTSSNV